MAWLHDQRCRVKENSSGSPTSSSSCIKSFFTLTNGYCVTQACPFYIGSDTSKKLYQSPVACFGASHRAIHKHDLAKLAWIYRRRLIGYIGLHYGRLLLMREFLSISYGFCSVCVFWTMW